MNRNENPGNYEGFIPGQIRVESGTVTKKVAMDLPNGREAMVTLRIGLDQSADREAQRQELLLTVNPVSLTEGLEKDLARLSEQFAEITHYDRDGQPVYRVTGRDREILQMKLANRRNALALAKRERALAEHVQAQAKAAKQAQEERIAAAAKQRAQQMIEDAEIERRASQLAARAGIGRK